MSGRSSPVYALLTVLALAVGAVGFAGVTGPAGVGAQDTSGGAPLTRVVIGHSNDAPTWAPLWLADTAGILRQRGLDAEVRSVGPGAVSIAALTRGDVQVLFTGGPGAVAGALDGADVALFGGYLDRMPFHLPPAQRRLQYSAPHPP